jgi:DNA-binding NtrC family response regulator
MMRSSLIITSKNDDLKLLQEAFHQDFRFSMASNIEQARMILERSRYDIVFVDLELLDQENKILTPEESIQMIKHSFPAVEIVVMAQQSRIRHAVRLVKAGAQDYITYPISLEEVKLVIDSITRSILRQSELDYLRDRFWKEDALEVVQTKSAVMVEVFKKIRSVASTRTTVLLEGETGTGKSVLAKLIHQHSNRQKAQFISVHCGAIPDTLLESELFGHEKGAFTGAVRKKLGKFEIANGGTIFLDEIGTLTPPAQIKLLQVLQDGTFSHVGGEETIHTNARVIAATNADLEQLSKDGQFRKDLFYRLNVFPITVPPLRERIEDIPYLADLFLNRLNREFQKSIQSIHAQVLEALAQYPWPGNVRELENLLERAYILENSSALTPEGFPKELFDYGGFSALMPVNTRIPLCDARKTALENFERQYIKDLVGRNKGKINISATEAGISTRQLHKLMSRYGIRKEQYKPNGA